MHALDERRLCENQTTAIILQFLERNFLWVSFSLCLLHSGISRTPRYPWLQCLFIVY